jgi:HAD superfamily hydrolase (TIGR01509 family)
VFDSVQADCGIDYRPHMEGLNKKELQRDAFKKDLKIINGINDVLSSVKMPMAIASGSEMDRLEYTLQLTNLYDHFNGRIYSSSLVPKGKPAPDIFLYAANELGVEPSKCLVIEDSLNGVRSGKAAGMTVFGFTGGNHIPDKQAHREELLSLNADLVFDDMSELPQLINSFKS